jgi:hypothetical protein
MSSIQDVATSDKHGRDSTTYVGDSNRLLDLTDSDQIFGEVSRGRCRGYVFCTPHGNPVAQTLEERGPEAMLMLANVV